MINDPKLERCLLIDDYYFSPFSSALNIRTRIRSGALKTENKNHDKSHFVLNRLNTIIHYIITMINCFMLAFSNFQWSRIHFNLNILCVVNGTLSFDRNAREIFATDKRQPRFWYNVNFRLSILSHLIVAPLKLKPLLVFAVTALSPHRRS